jgi:hypothetical protein
MCQALFSRTLSWQQPSIMGTLLLYHKKLWSCCNISFGTGALACITSQQYHNQDAKYEVINSVTSPSNRLVSLVHLGSALQATAASQRVSR